MSAAILQAEGLCKRYPSGDRTLTVLEGADLEVRAGERLAIIGPSGVGKSTLLHLLAGLDRPDDGRLLFRGRNLVDMSEDELATFRNAHIGMVFQFYHLLPEFSALENVMMPILIGRGRDGAEERARELLGQAGLAERTHHFPSELSGGERQRVAFARALAMEPEILLADEPTGNLDHDTGQRVMRIFDELHELHDTATVMVTHNPDLVSGFDRVLVMEPGGRLRSQDGPKPSAGPVRG